MEIEKVASAVSSAQNISGAVQSSGAQNSQIDELQRLADSIRKIENDCRITARVQGLSGAALQMKLRQYDDLLSKVDQQIHELQQRNRESAGDEKTIGVTMLQYNTDATRLTLRSTGTSTGTAVAEQRRSFLANTQMRAAERKAEQAAKAEKETMQRGQDRTPSAGFLDVLI